MEVVDLRRISALALGPVLEDQKRLWLRELGWDFTPSMAAIVALVGEAQLAGFALRYGHVVVGYCYYIMEERKGILGDLHLLEPFRTVENENRLIEASIREMMRQGVARRVEAQLMWLTSPFERAYPFAEFGRSFQRELMEVALPAGEEYAEGAVGGDDPGEGVDVALWQNRMVEDAGGLLARAYAGHVDSRVNDQYRTGAIAARFLQNIVEHPGCGTFAQLASYAAYSTVDGVRRMEGVSLASVVGAGAGHVTQICVSPEWRGKGLGYRLLRASLESMRKAGCRRASLSVTTVNEPARSLYTRMGFVRKRLFPASIWEGF